MFKVFVNGVIDFEEDSQLRKGDKRDKPDPYAIKSNEDLYATLMSWIGLWSKPYIVIDKHPTYFIVKDRGIRFRAWVYRKRFYDLIGCIPKKWFYVKGGRSKHIVITITVSRDLGIGEAFKFIKKRLRSIVSYFNKRYGVKAYLGVWEIHEDGYPHIHLIVFLRKSIPVFLYKRIWRFTHKRIWDKDLKVNRYGFIDCLALRGGKKGVRNYFSKYLSKTFSAADSGPNIGSAAENGSNINFKPYSLFIFRLFRVRPIIASFNLRRRIPKPSRITLEDLKLLDPKEYELYFLGKFIYENKPKEKNLISILKFENELNNRIESYLNKYVLSELNDLINISPNLCCHDGVRGKVVNEALEVFSKWERRLIPLGYCSIFSNLEN